MVAAHQGCQHQSGVMGSPASISADLCWAEGLPSSSRMWEPLLTRLGDQFQLVAPDYPGFGHTSAPSPLRPA
jgi:pimeloyl-ACP methyl ester carboxylesterase